MTIAEFLLARIAEDEQGTAHPQMLADIAAKRMIIERWVDPTALPSPSGYYTAIDDVLQDLAGAYSEHPDYEMWRS